MERIVTGTPGNGKTLYVIQKVEALRKAKDRAVYYWNIGALTLDWLPLGDSTTFGKLDERVEPDPSGALLWYDVPAGSIVVIDEAQKLFPVRPRGAAVPKHVSELETHRHRGIDIFLLTQNPKLIDSHVRKLCGEHYHLRRIFGMEKSRVFLWTEECADVDTRNNFTRAQSSVWKFPKEFYGTYKSADVHTHETKLPVKWLVTIAICVIAFPLLVWRAYTSFTGHGVDESVSPAELESALTRQREQTVKEVKEELQALMEANPWDARLHHARVASVDASKPFYDALVRPVSMPKIAGCAKLVVDAEIDCWCNSQQGTRLDMTVRECLSYLKNGWFDFTREDEVEEELRAEESAVVSSESSSTGASL